MSKEWYLPTGRTADEFMAEMKGNLRHDAEHLFGRIRQAHQRIAELEARVEPLQPFKERIAALEAERDDYKDRWEQTGCTRHGALEAAIKVNKELLKDIAELKALLAER
jgi:hypothetical protein